MAPEIYELLSNFIDWVGDDDPILIAHNAPFDSRFLISASNFSSVTIPDSWRIVDTLRWSRSSNIDTEDYSLGTLLEVIGYPLDVDHNSLSDAYGVADLTIHLSSQLKNPKSSLKRRLCSLSEMAYEPATGKQIGFLRRLGASEKELEGLEKFEASKLIDKYKSNSVNFDKEDEENTESSGCCAIFYLVSAIVIIYIIYKTFVD